MFAAATKIQVIFLFPLIFSIMSAIAYLFVGESTNLKVAATVVVALSVVLQFAPGLDIHFLIPLFMQLLVCVCFAIYWQTIR